MARKSLKQFAQIIEREFRKTLAVQPTTGVFVDMSEDEVIRILYDNDIYICDCDSDEEFVFIRCETPAHIVRFPIPTDYLED